MPLCRYADWLLRKSRTGKANKILKALIVAARGAVGSALNFVAHDRFIA
jgi:hypothetical protein